MPLSEFLTQTAVCYDADEYIDMLMKCAVIVFRGVLTKEDVYARVLSAPRRAHLASLKPAIKRRPGPVSLGYEVEARGPSCAVCGKKKMSTAYPRLCVFCEPTTPTKRAAAVQLCGAVKKMRAEQADAIRTCGACLLHLRNSPDRWMEAADLTTGGACVNYSCGNYLHRAHLSQQIRRFAPKAHALGGGFDDGPVPPSDWTDMF